MVFLWSGVRQGTPPPPHEGGRASLPPLTFDHKTTKSIDETPGNLRARIFTHTVVIVGWLS